jgi:hypothetical protein
MLILKMEISKVLEEAPAVPTNQPTMKQDHSQTQVQTVQKRSPVLIETG